MSENEEYKLLYQDKNYSGLKEFLKDSTEIRSFNLLGKSAFLNGFIDEAEYYFKKAENILALCYCYFFSGNLKECEKNLVNIKEESSAAKWLYFITNLMLKNRTEPPSYFQIRNFFEQDFELMFFYNQKRYIKIILLNLSKLSNYNKEIYKYCARVLLNNNYTDESLKLIKKSLDIYYKDPETHYLQGEAYKKKKAYNKAKNSFEKSIEVSNEYFPAEKELRNLKNKLIV